MATENAKAFIEKMNSDAKFRAKIGDAVSDNITAIAKEYGFDTNAEEIEKAYKEMRSVSGDVPVEIPLDEMDQIAGGRGFYGETASDDHELGCWLSYHHLGWQEEHDEWCKTNYFCNNGINVYSTSAVELGNSL